MSVLLTAALVAAVLVAGFFGLFVWGLCRAVAQMEAYYDFDGADLSKSPASGVDVRARQSRRGAAEGFTVSGHRRPNTTRRAWGFR